MTIIAFHVVSVDDSNAFSKEVEQYLERGYTLHGKMRLINKVVNTYSSVVYVQALVKTAETALTQ